MRPHEYTKDAEYINGLPSFLDIQHHALPDGMADVSSGTDALGFYIKITPRDMPPGSVIVLETSLYRETKLKLEKYRKLMNVTAHGSWYLDGVVRFAIPDLAASLQDLSIEEMNIVLFRCDEEERDSCGGNGVYEVPGHGKLAYAGLFGFAYMLKSVSKNNNLGHAFCEHLRAGFWCMDYIVERLERYLVKYPRLEKFIKWLKARFTLVRLAPNFLLPKYFNITVATASFHAQNHCYSLMSNFIRGSNRFVRSLALVTVQCYGQVPSTGISPLRSTASLAAGLPHFATNHMRCWGRDVFISLKGILLTTGLHAQAKEHLLMFASTLKHGLIPNLLDSGRTPRYNARDAVWWFAQCVQDYCSLAEEGVAFLDEKVLRRFANDEFIPYDDKLAFTKTSTMREILHEIMQCHAMGISFVEHNAGPNLDHAMRNEGFRVDVKLDSETGIIYGGNRYNCGTWMDKMGDSELAGTKGLPATPRDGAAIEITGLLKSTLRWLKNLHADGKFDEGVELTDGTSLKFADWNDRLQ